MCHHVVCWVGTNILDEPDAFLIRVDYKATQKNMVHHPNYFLLFLVSCAVFSLHGLVIYPEAGGRRFLQNICIHALCKFLMS